MYSKSSSTSTTLIKFHQYNAFSLFIYYRISDFFLKTSHIVQGVYISSNVGIQFWSLTILRPEEISTCKYIWCQITLLGPTFHSLPILRETIKEACSTFARIWLFLRLLTLANSYFPLVSYSTHFPPKKDKVALKPYWKIQLRNVLLFGFLFFL